MSDVAGLIAGNVPVMWWEAVALVREVCDRLLEDPFTHIPELDQIQLSPEGRVTLTGGARTNEPVRRLGQLLLALIANAEAPVQLRLVVGQATAPAPAYHSVREYSEALAFFERPDRSAVLRELAKRAAAAPQPDVADKALTLDALAPLPADADTHKEQPRSPDGRTRSGGLRFALAAAIVLLIVGGAGWYAWSRGLGPRNRQDVSVLASRASQAVGTAVISGASAVTETLGLGRVVPASQATDPLATQPAPAPPPKVPEPKQREPEPPQPAPPLLAFDLDPIPGPAQASAGLAPEGKSADLSIPPPPPDDPTIYSLESPDVTPPIPPRPPIAVELPPGFDRDRLGQIELIIAKDGRVESAKLLTAPRNVNDGLFLSAAKAWNFQPALKRGVPVRYRKVIWIARP